MSHSRRSCQSGANAGYHPDHGAAECNLCALLDLYDGDDVDVQIEVRLSRPSR